ncbi:hypothetical protein GCM10027605_67220 [Micromonospora zhanjiangensis]
MLALGAAATATRTAAAAAADPGTPVRVNQAAYVPGAPKQATVANSSGSPIGWTLRNAAGVTVASGQTTVKGADAMSGDTVHVIDFSSYDVVGTGYVLSAGGADSYPFDISADPVKKLRYDTLAFFYHQRSGIPILSQYVGNAYARPAGHLNVSPNQGDNNVPCRASCGYTQDLRGGWYDAGDQGKYVVNGGISSWQLQNEYERAVNIPGADAAALGDNTLAIPERGNGVPDILDEARWEVSFLLKMQVPDGRPDAGMARHKMSDANWTGLPQRPELDSQPRVSSAVSTAATLNLAAVAAQSARLWKTLDPTFSATALAAARKAYAAAKANPARYADANDGSGSGTYADNNVTDEFYWAAAELYVTTGEAAYRTDLTGSSLYRGGSYTNQGFDWGWVGGLGDATLAIVPNGLPAADITAIRQAMTGFADRMLAVMAGEGIRRRPLLQLGVDRQHRQQRQRAGSGVRLHRAAEVPGRGLPDAGLPARTQPVEPVLHRRLRRQPGAERAPPVLGALAGQLAAHRPAGRRLRWRQQEHRGPVRGGPSRRVRAATVPRGQHRGVLGERGGAELELGGGLAGQLGGGEGRQRLHHAAHPHPDADHLAHGVPDPVADHLADGVADHLAHGRAGGRLPGDLHGQLLEQRVHRERHGREHRLHRVERLDRAVPLRERADRDPVLVQHGHPVRRGRHGRQREL